MWAALEGLPTYEQLHAAGHMQARQLRPHTEALQALPCCGPGLQQTAVAKVVLQVGRLQQWQQQQQPGVGCAIAGGSSSAAFSAGAAAASLSRQLQQLQGKLLPEEYGAALDVQLPEGPAALAWFLGSSSMPQRSAAAAAGSGAVSVSTPGELRQLFAAEAAADDLGWGGAAGGAAAAVAGGDEYDVDIDSDDERKGRGKKVSGMRSLGSTACLPCGQLCGDMPAYGGAAIAAACPANVCAVPAGLLWQCFRTCTTSPACNRAAA